MEQIEQRVTCPGCNGTGDDGDSEVGGCAICGAAGWITPQEMAELQTDPFTQWVRERPAEVRQLMVEWPPDARVRTREGVSLLVPAPGVEGRIASWFENGMVGVEAPLAAPAGPNFRGEVLPKGEVLRAECDPTNLELVGYSTYGDTEITPDLIRGIIGGDA